MKTLYITGSNVPYAGVSGGQAASLGVLRMYAALGPVDLVALAESTEGDVDVAPLHRLCQRVVLVPSQLLYARHPVHHGLTAARALLSGTSFKLRKFRTEALDRALRDLASGDSWDVVHFDGLPMAQFSGLFGRSRRVLLQQNVEWEIFTRQARHARFLPLRWFAAIEARRLRRAEIALCEQADLVLTLSDRDQEILATAGCTSEMATLRLPVDVPDTPPQPFERTGPVVVSLGNLTSIGRQQGTLWFHQQVWPRVRRVIPAAEWRIVGANPSRAIRALDGSDGVRVLGFVHDLDRALAGVRACVIPLHIGGGIRIKILDMFAQGIPCVATSVGAQGLDITPEREMLIADDPAGFAGAVVRVLREPEVRQRLVEHGRCFVERQHSAVACQASFAHLLDGVIGRNGAVPELSLTR